MNNQFTWLHIGLGSFHRASGVVSASSDCFRDNRWRIAAGNIRNDAEQVVRWRRREDVTSSRPSARKGARI